MRKRTRKILAGIIAIVMIITMFPPVCECNMEKGKKARAAITATTYTVVYETSEGLKQTPDGSALYFLDKIPKSNVITTAKIAGWIIGSNVGKVTVVINGVEYICTRSSRTDVKEAYPNYDTSKAGFEFDLNTTQMNNGKNTLSIRAYTSTSTYNEIYNGTVYSIKLDPIYFDWSWYYYKYHKDSAIETIGRNPEKLMEHYYTKGIENGYSPCIGYDPEWYISKNTDLQNYYEKKDYTSAYAHFVTDCLEGNSKREVSAFLNLTYYQTKNTDLNGKTAADLFLHFCIYGSRLESRNNGNSTDTAKALAKMFVAKEYANANADIKQQCGDGTTTQSSDALWSNFFAFSLVDNEKRRYSNQFDMKIYMENYGIASAEEAFWRYINSGYTNNELTLERISSTPALVTPSPTPTPLYDPIPPTSSGETPTPSVGTTTPTPSVGTTTPTPSVGTTKPTPFVGTTKPTPFVGTTKPTPFVGTTTPTPFVGTTKPTPFVGTTTSTPSVGTTTSTPSVGTTTPTPSVGTTTPTPFIGTTTSTPSVGTTTSTPSVGTTTSTPSAGTTTSTPSIGTTTPTPSVGTTTPTPSVGTTTPTPSAGTATPTPSAETTTPTPSAEITTSTSILISKVETPIPTVTVPVSSIELVQNEEKKEQTISAKSIKKTYGSAKFSLEAETNGDGTLTYKSSNEKVAKIGSNGKVTITGCGKTKITISASETSQYNSASKKIVLTVYIKTPVITQITSPEKGKFYCYWKKNKAASGYEFYISKNKKFNLAMPGKITKNIANKKITGLTSGNKYYFKVRTYVKKRNKTFYSSWSGVKSLKVQ